MKQKPGFFTRKRDAAVVFLLLTLVLAAVASTLGGVSPARASVLTAPGIQIYDRVPKDPTDLSRGFYPEKWSQERMRDEVVKAGASGVGIWKEFERVVCVDVKREWTVDYLAPSCDDSRNPWRLFRVAPDQWEEGERSYLVIMPNTIPLKPGWIVVRLGDGSCVTLEEDP